MNIFLVERDLSGISLADLHGVRAAAQRQAERMFDEGDRVSYLRSTYLPEDGRCFCLFQAKSAEVIIALNRAAMLPFEKISLATDLVP